MVFLKELEQGQLFWMPSQGAWRKGATFPGEIGKVSCHSVLNTSGGHCYLRANYETIELPIDTLVDPFMHR